MIPKDDDAESGESSRGDAEGQISIHLPHNSLLVMHAEMQEEWKHSIAPAQAIDPHPIAKNKRINITYRCYKESLHPKFTPRCRCNVSAVLRCVQRKKENRGRYMWMCHANYTPGKEGYVSSSACVARLNANTTAAARSFNGRNLMTTGSHHGLRRS